MDVPVGEIAKLTAIFGSFGGAAGSSFAFLRPFAAQWLSLRLERAKRRAEIEDAKDGALLKIAEQSERTVGVLESFERHLVRIDGRLDRLEAHQGISLTPSAVPPEEAPVKPRRQLTDPGLRRAESTIPPVSVDAGR